MPGLCRSGQNAKSPATQNDLSVANIQILWMCHCEERFRPKGERRGNLMFHSLLLHIRDLLIFRSNNPGLGCVDLRHTIILHTYSPAASSGWGILFSPTWGRIPVSLVQFVSLPCGLASRVIASKSGFWLFSGVRTGINPLLSTWKPFGLANLSPARASMC